MYTRALNREDISRMLRSDRRRSEVGGQRVTRCRALFQPPPPEPDVQLSPHPALQCLDRLGKWGLCALHSPAFPTVPVHLPPFAMEMAFPSSDYYGGSVALGLVPRRQSRVSCMLDVQNGLGAPFVPLRLLIVTCLPWSMLNPVAAKDRGSGSPGCQPSYPGSVLYISGTRVHAV